MMVANPSKFQVMFMGLGNDCKLCLEIDKMAITTVDKVKILGVIIDSKLRLDKHVKSLCLKASRNISALSRVAKVVISLNANYIIISLFCQTLGIILSFGCFVENNKEIDMVHKRARRILLRDYDAPFVELLVKNEEKTIHVKNLRMLMIEVYKSLNHQNPPFLWELFARKEINYNLRIKDILKLPKALTSPLVINSISFRAACFGTVHLM